ncbi:MAG TPA: polysaccharide biosynthesis/export family protein [Opitutales bacterium]|jgi:polysaccharide export outer membrane protein|nr:polysaccharide biosynthesis/export family protein [Opitutales bacterium]
MISLRKLDLALLGFGCFLPWMAWAGMASALQSKPTSEPSAQNAPATPTSPAKDSAAPKPYVLRAMDVITVDVADDDKASHEYKISLDGTTLIKYLSKPIQLAGLTVEQAVAAIGQAYTDAKIYTKPQITLLVKEYAPRRINFLGEVAHPGWVNIPPEEELTLVSAFSEAGGHTPRASRYCNITRRLPDGTTTILKNVDLRAAVEDMSKDIALQEGDTVFLGESLFQDAWH